MVTSAAWYRSLFFLTGGEPFSRRNDLFKILEHIENKCAHITNYDILTNGTLLDDYDMLRLKELKKLRRIQVSLEGSNPEIHDRIRGKGDFEKVL